ncbi:MAG: prepilin-type N-terminal cleavage/methylation domain-containing protein [Deltaproteobacteria bacterium]|nr:prepilin-type N-terminal cleavage/methylation domain-containing protein [Candidatus Anaeroferrophillacea bacterium]
MKAIRPKCSRGFTLIELMVSLAILAFGILGFLFLQGRAIEGRVFGREMSRATFVAEGCLEGLLALDYHHGRLSTEANGAPRAHPTAAEGGTDALGTGTLVETHPHGNFDYFSNWIVTEPVANAAKAMQLTVTWRFKDPDKGIQEKTLVMNTVKAIGQ